MLSRQLDPSTLRSWKEHSAEKKIDSYIDLVAFLYHRVGVLEVLPSTSSGKPPKQRVFATTTMPNNNTKGCACCHRDHPVYACDEFKQLSLNAKQKVDRTNCVIIVFVLVIIYVNENLPAPVRVVTSAIIHNCVLYHNPRLLYRHQKKNNEIHRPR